MPEYYADAYYFPEEHTYNDEVIFPDHFNNYSYMEVYGWEVKKTNLGNYVMTFEMGKWSYDCGDIIGTFISYSEDGINWSQAMMIVEGHEELEFLHVLETENTLLAITADYDNELIIGNTPPFASVLILPQLKK